jgi:hypothetical protein
LNIDTDKETDTNRDKVRDTNMDKQRIILLISGTKIGLL